MLRVLAKMGVEKIFASPGSEWSPVWEALAEPGVEGMPQYYSTRHEEVAVGMASGYAKSTGKLPAVMIHTTVGSLHATMGMRAAVREQVPMVVLTGESVGFGEDEGPDPGGQWLGHLSNIGGPAKLVESTVGFDAVKVWHCNDAKAAMGSKLDRHEHIGEGTIGAEAFRRLLHDARFAHAAFIAETPVDAPGDEARNVGVLRTLAAG